MTSPGNDPQRASEPLAPTRVLLVPPASRAPRVWPALPALYVVAPTIGGMLSGSIPPLTFVNPFIDLGRRAARLCASDVAVTL